MLFKYISERLSLRGTVNRGHFYHLLEMLSDGILSLGGAGKLDNSKMIYLKVTNNIRSYTEMDGE